MAGVTDATCGLSSEQVNNGPKHVGHSLGATNIERNAVQSKTVLSNGIDSRATNPLENAVYRGPTGNAKMNGEAVSGHVEMLRNDVHTGSKFSPIAICGMACRLPGGISTPEQLWTFLEQGQDARSRVPKSRFNIAAYHSPVKRPGSAITEHGYFLDDDVDLGALDTSMLSIRRNEVARLDPQQRLLLEVARESIDDAGEIDWKGSDIGVYVGTFSQDWYDAFNREPLKYGIYQATATHDFMMSERLSHEMDLRGPSMTIRTACSSALVGLNEACMAIARGDCQSAIVGGTSIIMAPALMTAMSEQGVLSPDGSCKTFSADADGYARGEAIVSVYVKSLDAALRDGNPIRSVIIGTAVNFDGKTPTLSTPNPVTQEALIRRAYDTAGISDYCKTGFFECHGTGTSVGDVVETNAVAAVLGDRGVTLGSIKPNLGHSEGASGLTSLLKAVLALEHRTIPPSIKHLPLNPKIPFQRAKLTVPDRPMQWPRDREERVSINSFGVGGTNAHVIVESVAKYTVPRATSEPKRAKSHAPQLLLLSANTANALKDMIDNYKSFLSTTSEDYADIAYTLARRRAHMAHRSFAVVAKDTFDANATWPSQDASLSGQNGRAAPSIVMVFTGQGATWPQFGRELLLLSDSIFSMTVRSLDKHLQRLGKTAPAWSLVEEIVKPARNSRVYEAEFSQPICTAVQIALVDTLASLGIKPAAVVGHSSGEIAAAYASGGLTAEEAILVSFHRGATAKLQTQPGEMAAVGLSWEDAQEYLVPGVVTACDNSPTSVTLSGDSDRLEDVLRVIKESHPNAPITPLKVKRAYHSQHMESLGPAYQQALVDSGVVGKAPLIPFFSSVVGKRYGCSNDDTFGPSYWRANLERPVLFKAASSSILQCREITNEVFLELGPHSALAAPLRQIFKHNASNAVYVPSLVRRQNSVESLLQTIGKLYARSVDVDFKALMPDGTCVSDLPRYPWDHQRRHWFESRISKEWREQTHPQHDLLGIKVPESTDLEPMWRNLLHVENVPWLCDHKIDEDIVFPFAAYVAMAAEAALQTCGALDEVSFRRIVVKTALLVNLENPSELVTTLRRQPLTNSLSSDWWEFSIFSHSGHVWTKHCSGEVRAEDIHEPSSLSQQPNGLPRKVDIARWNDTLRRHGLNYGPHFQTLRDVRCSTGTAHEARASLRNNSWGDETYYHLHPVILDSYFQLLDIATWNGMARAYRRQVPASVESLTIRRCAEPELQVLATAVYTEDGVIGHGSCESDSKQILQSSGVRVSLFEKAAVEDDNDMPTAARCEWVQHIDFQDINHLLEHPRVSNSSYALLVELVHLVITLSSRLAESIQVQTPHLAKYKVWLREQSMSQSKDLDADKMSQRIVPLFEHLRVTPFARAAESIVAVFHNMKSLLEEEKPILEILGKQCYFDDFIALMKEYDNSKYLQCLAHSKPNLKVLEIGAGLGDQTESFLKAMTRPNGQVLYSEYLHTDASSGIISTAKERQQGTINLEFATLDVSQDIADQGLEGRGFDLVIAQNVLSTTGTVRDSLRNVRGLLAPDGRLLLQEPEVGLLWTKFVLATLPDWWAHDGDKRVDGPLMGLARWQEELLAAGFEEVDVVATNPTSPAGNVIVARSQCRRIPARKITVLCDNEEEKSTSTIEELERRGYEVSRCSLDETPPQGQDVLALLDEQQSFFNNLTAAKFSKLKEFIIGLSNSGMFWVTRRCNTGCLDPGYATVIGLARTLRSEMEIDFAVCETDDIVSSSVSSMLVTVLQHFQSRENSALLGPDYEYAIRNCQILVNRIFPFSDNQEWMAPDTSREAIVTIAQQARLDTLRWTALSARAPEPDEIEVEVYASGLNFRDVLVAMGLIERRDPTFGYEAAGLVRRVGANVSKLKVGDRAVLMGIKTLSTVVTAAATLFEKLPDNITFEEGATMPLIFTTAIYCLINVGRLLEGQTILIHSGCGGVGLAAIQIALMLRAEVYTTVGNEEKVQYLMRTFNIPRNRIFNSRNTSFIDGLLHETDGKGVDLALNSLSGEQLHATWKCVAQWGTMVEIGKRDLLGAAKLDMTPFLANRSYCCVDLDQMSRERPEMVSRLLHTMMEYVHQGHVNPIQIAQLYSGSEVQDALRFMQQGKHIGKIILQIRNKLGQPQMGNIDTSQKGRIEFNSTASYLIVGGTGGLGRAICIWMVEHGAKKLSILSRSAGKTERDHDLVREIESMGCSIQLTQGDVTSPDDVAHAVDSTLAPLKGIVQLSMVLRDQMFDRLSFEDWNDVMKPKVQGTWNLHNVTVSRNLNLDLFVLFSSLSGILGQIGQTNYASANTFLDAFVQYRAGKGLPCTAIDLGAMEGIGYLSENQDLLRKMQGTGWRAVQEAELLNALEIAMVPQAEQEPKNQGDMSWITHNSFLLGLSPSVPLSSQDSNARLRKDIRMAAYHNVGRQSSKTASANEGLRLFLRSVKDDPNLLKSTDSTTLLAREIGKKLFSLLLRPEDEDIDISINTANLGLDSLIAIELRGWWKLNLGFDITVLEMLSMGTLEALGQFAVDKLSALYGE
ncbi:MAG: Type I Iterative PKS [Chrysothrix sp. TS-e1954]|nr:MAG: Type I Iterative PKS [Chrysothrix sp. TS-e1954]